MSRTASACIALAAPLVIAAHPVSPRTGFDVTEYRVSLIPRLSGGEVAGHEEIRLIPTEDGLATLRFSPNALNITGAMLDGKSVEVRADEQGIVFTPAHVLKRGKPVRLTFHYAGTPSRGVTMLPGGMYSSYFACDWMVCLQDSPGDKARLTLKITIPNAMRVTAPGRRTLVQAAGEGAKAETWSTRREWSPYLYAFAIGDFPEAESGRLGFVNASGEAADLAAMFAQTKDMVAFLSKKAGMPLPVDRFTQILVPGYEAQEAAGMSLIGRKALERDLGDPEGQWILIHELAHQYWGNLVTCASWKDFWLNEGFATFMTAAWKEHRFGRAAYEAELDVARRRLEKVRAVGFDKPLAWDGDYPSIGMRRAVQYGKAALFLDHLRKLLGDAAFWSGVRQYTRAHAGGTVTGADLQQAMEAASGRDLSVDFTRWVSGDQ